MAYGAKSYSRPPPQMLVPPSIGSNQIVSPSPTLLYSVFPVFVCFRLGASSHHFFFLDPVLFASSCGELCANPPSTTTATPRNEAAHDLRLSSISAAIEFSKNNNLLGVFLDTYLLV